ncbi:MAG TPA: DUF5615 family PIN-like protein [Fodinibius sp.]|nr:DUF5615 family PIN-like protein [Fodinibius sp.]
MRRRGIDILTISEAGKLGASDEEHFTFARQQGRAIVTHDTDFLRLAASSSDHSGVVYAPQEQTIGEMVRKASLIARIITQEEMRGHVEYI